MLTLGILLQEAGIIGTALDSANTVLGAPSAIATLGSTGATIKDKIEEQNLLREIMPDVDYTSLPEEMIPLYEQIARCCQEQKDEYTGGFSFSADQKARMTEKILQENPGYRDRYGEVDGTINSFYIKLEKAINQIMSPGEQQILTDTKNLRQSDKEILVLLKEITDLLKEVSAKSQEQEPGSPKGRMLKKLKTRLKYEQENHTSFKLMNEAYGFDSELIPKGRLLIPLAGRKAELDDYEGHAFGEKKDSKTLAEYFRENRNTKKWKHITIEGEGGIGKTVALLSLAMEPDIFPEGVPAIYVPLHLLNKTQYRPSQGHSRLDWYIDTYLKDKCRCTDEERNAFYDLCDHVKERTVQTVLLLDGYNEVLDSLKKQVRSDIDEWASKPGVQIITTSRTAWSCGDDFMKIKLQPLTEDTIRTYLKNAGAKIPASGDNLWRVIDYPLMLTLYTHISAVQGQAREGLSPDLHVLWHPMNCAGDIIWNYLQKELIRCVKSIGDGEDSNPEDYAVAILHTAPYVAWRMSRADVFSLPLTEEDECANEQVVSFFGLIRESLECLKDLGKWTRQLKRLICGRDNSSNRIRKWIRLAGDPDSDEMFDKAEKIAALLLNEVNLFRQREEESQETDSKNMDMSSVQMMHQQFRDGLAAIWLCRQIETMESLVIPENGIFKSTGDKYALPLCWREKIGRYVLKFSAEIMDDDLAKKFWEVGRLYQPSDVKFAYTMFNLMSERSVKDGIRSNDFSGLDLYGMDLRNISLFLYREEGSHKLKLPHGTDSGRLTKTEVSAGTYMSQGHRGSVSSVSLSGDGKRAVSGGYDGIVRIWDLESMTCEGALEGHRRLVPSVSMSGDGKRAVSGGYDGIVRIWDLESMTCEGALEGHRDGVSSVSMSGDGKRAVSGGYDGMLRIWDLESMICEGALEGHRGQVLSVSMSGDGKRAVSVGYDTIVRIWDLESMTCEGALEGHRGQVLSVSISGDGKRAVSGGYDRIVRIWDLESMTCEGALEGHREWVLSVSLSGDGKRAVSGGYDGSVRIWDLESMTCEGALEGHRNEVGSVSMSGDGKRAVSGGVDGSVRFWDLESIACEGAMEGHRGSVSSVSLSGDGKRAVSGGHDGMLRIWDLESMACEGALEGHRDGVSSVSLSGDGKRAVSGGYDGMLRILDLESMTCEGALEGHRGSVSSVSMSGDGKRAVSGGHDGMLRIWDLESMACEGALEGHRDGVSSVSLSGDGKRAVSSGYDRIVRIWDLESMTCEGALEGHRGQVLSVSMSGDGKRAVSGGYDGIVRIWDLESIACEGALEDHGGGVSSVSLSGDGKRAVSSGVDGIVRIWDLESMACEAALEGHMKGYRVWDMSVSLSRDGKRAVDVGDDGSMRIWDLESMTCLKKIKPLPGIDISGIDLRNAVIESEEDREILRQNGALV